MEGAGLSREEEPGSVKGIIKNIGHFGLREKKEGTLGMVKRKDSIILNWLE